MELICILEYSIKTLSGPLRMSVWNQELFLFIDLDLYIFDIANIFQIDSFTRFHLDHVRKIPDLSSMNVFLVKNYLILGRTRSARW